MSQGCSGSVASSLSSGRVGMWVRSRSCWEPPLRGGCSLRSCRGAAAGGGPRDVSAGGSALEILAGGAGTHPSRENFVLLGKPPQHSSRGRGGDVWAACGQPELSGCRGHRSSSVCPTSPRRSTEPLHACLCHRNTAPAPALLPPSLLTLPWWPPGSHWVLRPRGDTQEGARGDTHPWGCAARLCCPSWRGFACPWGAGAAAGLARLLGSCWPSGTSMAKGDTGNTRQFPHPPVCVLGVGRNPPVRGTGLSWAGPGATVHPCPHVTALL